MVDYCPQCHTAIVSDAHACLNCGAKLIPPDGFTSTPTASSPRNFEEISAGTILKGKYRVLQKIGSGGMGVVFKAEDLKLKRIVALKFLSSKLAGWQARERFIHEARAASELDHPNICTVYEFDETESGQLYIAMPYYRGENLREKIGRGTISIEDAVAIAIQLAGGLVSAHQHGIVHRDIKPANILITEEGVAKIVDFGLARLTGATRITRPGTTMGTLAYMSPEQIQGHKLDQRTDLWSLGVVMFEMLTGSRPFKDQTEASLLYSIVHERPDRINTLNPKVLSDLERIVFHALEKKPEARYTSAEELKKDLENYKKRIAAVVSGEFNLRWLFNHIRKPQIALPAIVFFVIAAFLASWYFNREAKIRWAKEEALPKADRLVFSSLTEFGEAYALAEKAEQFIPNDPKLVELFSKCSVKINIKTEPAGAKIFIKEYKIPNVEWKYLGISPLKKIRLPIGVFRWKIEKEGYETVLAAATTWDVTRDKEVLVVPYDFVRVLDKNGSNHPDMVRVKGGDTAIGKIEDFYIDRYEVTNRNYKRFIQNGGYKNKKYWKEKFIQDGKELTWEDAIKQFVDETGQYGPTEWQAGDYAEGQDDYPVSGISWYEAAAYAEFEGKTLPSHEHWELARGGYTPLIQRGLAGGIALFVPFSNFYKAKGPIPVGNLDGITAYGAYDMAGNVREWCWNKTPKGRLIHGGAWNDYPYMFANFSQAPPMDRSEKNGFRCALYPDPQKVSAAVSQIVTFEDPKNFYKEKPVSDSVFQVYKDQFSYDKTDLKARAESRKETSDWIQEKITFDAAYGSERIIAYLFLPKNAVPPYQTIIYFPGSGSVYQRSSRNLDNFWEFRAFVSFLVKNGRAVLYPVYKATFERGNDELTTLHEEDWSSRKYTELLIQVTKDLKRSIDYLETRTDIDLTKLGYEGLSWGGMYGAIIPAVEERLKVNIMISGGIGDEGRPEVKQINYVTRVNIPTLMLNGKYDAGFQLETSIKPMYDLLGTPPKDKYLKLYETDHILPHNEVVKEILAFLDRYFGPVR